MSCLWLVFAGQRVGKISERDLPESRRFSGEHSEENVMRWCVVFSRGKQYKNVMVTTAKSWHFLFGFISKDDKDLSVWTFFLFYLKARLVVTCKADLLGCSLLHAYVQAGPSVQTVSTYLHLSLSFLFSLCDSRPHSLWDWSGSVLLAGDDFSKQIF